MMLLILVWLMISISETALHKTSPADGIRNSSFSMTCKKSLDGVNGSNTTIQLCSGLIDLTLPLYIMNSSGTISNLVISGTGVSTTIIQCTNTRAGLCFIGIRNLNITNLTISNCGMLQLVNSHSSVQYASAVSIYNSSNITIQSVSFKHNNGIGLSMINTNGFVSISDCVFDGNRITNSDYPGGVGLFIEFPFCLPSYSASFCSQYNITFCTFTNNVAEVGSHFSNKTVSHYVDQIFGRGGGMSVISKNNASNNILNISDAKFIGNTAVYGGGVFFGFYHHANNNSLYVHSSRFFNNSCKDNYNPENTGGGGIQIFYNYHSSVFPNHNSLGFVNCSFKYNRAYWGGGVAYVLGKRQHSLGTNKLNFRNCCWYGNLAKFGAAIDFYRPLSTGAARAVVLENCSFIHNKVFYDMETGQFDLQGAGTVYANSIIINFKGYVEFTKNIGSALVLFTSYAHVISGGIVNFTQNEGWRGGAISLLASSWIKVEESTNIVFDGNYADEIGGAMYVELISEHKIVPQWNCFFQFSDPSISPDNWKTKVQFQQNYAFLGGHAIYVTSLHSCVWNKDKDDVKSAFHWKSFEFDGEPGTHNFSRKSEIATAANDLTSNQSNIKVSPGENFPLPFKHLDDEGHNTDVIFFMQSDDKNIGSVDDQHIYSGVMQVYDAPNTHFNVTMKSLAPIPYTVTLNVTFDYCPPGYIVYKKKAYDNSTSCKCANEGSTRIPGISECNNTLYQAYITRYNWGGIHEPSGKFVTADCPQGYCTFSKLKYKSLLPRNRSDLDYFQCRKQHRTGEICGKCMSGYGISSQSNCVKCNHGFFKGFLLFLACECLPTILFVSIILIFNVNITSGYWNSLIFYFQIVEILNLYALQSINEYPKGYKILINIHTYLFGIWNLNYYSPDVCYFSWMKHVFWLYVLQYITVIIAFVSVGILVVIKNLPCTLFNCQGNNLQTNGERIEESGCYNRLRNLCHSIILACKQWFNADSQLIHGIATVLVLSYTKIALLSMKFFIPAPVYTAHDNVVEIRTHHVGTIKYFQGEHLYFAIPAGFLLLLSAMFPLYLIFKAKECCNKCDAQGKLKLFLLEFYGSFRDEYCYYGGFFFVYRFVLYATFAFTPSLMIQYCVQQCLLGIFLFINSILQPYSDNYSFANKLDAVIFLNLIIINALSIFNFYSVIDIQSPSQGALIVQLILVYLPLLYIPFRVIWYCHGQQGRHPRNHEEQEGLMDPVAERDHWANEDQSVDLSEYDQIPQVDSPLLGANATNPRS